MHAGRSSVVLIKAMLVDVLNDRSRNEISHAHLALEEQADLGAADVVLDQLLDHVDVFFPVLQARQGVVDVGACTLDDEGPVAAEDVVEILGAPDVRGGHGLDEVGAGEKSDADGLAGSGLGFDAASNGVDLVLDVVEHFGGGGVFFSDGFPGVYHEPV